jgi:hypothetical protein
MTLVLDPPQTVATYTPFPSHPQSTVTMRSCSAGRTARCLARHPPGSASRAPSKSDRPDDRFAGSRQAASTRDEGGASRLAHTAMKVREPGQSGMCSPKSHHSFFCAHRPAALRTRGVYEEVVVNFASTVGYSPQLCLVAIAPTTGKARARFSSNTPDLRSPSPPSRSCVTCRARRRTPRAVPVVLLDECARDTSVWCRPRRSNSSPNAFLVMAVGTLADLRTAGMSAFPLTSTLRPPVQPARGTTTSWRNGHDTPRPPTINLSRAAPVWHRGAQALSLSLLHPRRRPCSLSTGLWPGRRHPPCRCGSSCGGDTASAFRRPLAQGAPVEVSHVATSPTAAMLLGRAKRRVRVHRGATSQRAR